MLAIAAKYAGDADSPLATVWMLFLTALIYTICR
jgi:hypothetical protein